MRTLIVLIAVLFFCAGASGAETGGSGAAKKSAKRYIYEWTDSRGGVHITDDFGEVPERYRAKARAIEMPKGREVVPGQQSVEGTETPAGLSAEQQEAESKAAWQKRIRDWKERLADARKRYNELDKKREEALTKWGSPASGHLEGRAEADRISEDMKEVQSEIDECTTMIETVIPEEARRAGIPPGWLRE